MKGYKLNGVLLMILLAVFLLMNGCEKNTVEPIQPIPKILETGRSTETDTGSVDFEELSETVFSCGWVTGEENLPSAVKWYWRRVQIDGNLSCFGHDNVNGDPNTSTILNDAEINWNLETPDGSGLAYWLDDPTWFFSRGNGSVLPGGNYHGSFDGDGTGWPCFTMQNWVSNVGETMSVGDTVSYSINLNNVSNATNFQTQLYIYSKDGYEGGRTYPASMQPGTVSSWKLSQATLKLTQAPWDIGYLRFVMVAMSGTNVTGDFDDIRLYSSASDLPPIARVYGLELEPTQGEGVFDVNFTLEDANGLENGCTVLLYYEDPTDGLYYRANEDDIGDGLTEEGSYAIEDVRFSEDFLNILNTYEQIRILPATAGLGFEVHINEVDAIMFSY